MRSDRLFSRDFTLMVAGQIISLFGNAILRFALSLHVLDTTGSAAAFGGILAVSMVPTILCSPLGGVLADRVPRQRIMWGLDFFTAALVLGYGLFFASRGTVLAVGVLMVLLAAIQALYQPSVQASIPALASEEHLPAANGVVAQVQALANLLGPILGGMLYGWVGLLPMVAVGGACFFCSAVMELFLRIPFQRRTLAGPPLAALWRDLRDAGRFLTREQPGLLRVLALVALLNLFLSALLVVGLPYLVKISLGLSSLHYSFAEAALSLGSIVGGLALWAGAPRRGYPPGLAVSAGHLPAAAPHGPGSGAGNSVPGRLWSHPGLCFAGHGLRHAVYRLRPDLSSAGHAAPPAGQGGLLCGSYFHLCHASWAGLVRPAVRCPSGPRLGGCGAGHGGQPAGDLFLRPGPGPPPRP